MTNQYRPRTELSKRAVALADSMGLPDDHRLRVKAKDFDKLRAARMEDNDISPRYVLTVMMGFKMEIMHFQFIAGNK